MAVNISMYLYLDRIRANQMLKASESSIVMFFTTKHENQWPKILIIVSFD